MSEPLAPMVPFPSIMTGRLFEKPEQVSEALGIPFSDEQLQAITAPLEPTVIIAGAGSGKTTVMAARVVWLVGTGQVRPDQVLGLTFTRKAAGELASRVRQALQTGGVLRQGSDEQGEEVIMTYDAFAGRLLGEHGQRIGVETDPVLISGAARFRLAERVVRDAQGPFTYLANYRPATVVERLLALDAMLTSHLVSTDEVRQDTPRLLNLLEQAPPNRRGNVYASVRDSLVSVGQRHELLDLVDDYTALKQSLGVVEFADQMALAARIVSEVPSVPPSVRAQFGAVLLDEYQDTSAAQAQLLAGLFSAGEGVGHPVTAVGDPFQAIYGWRGAAASNILHFHQDFPRRREPQLVPAARLQLSINRRSGHRILAVANGLAEPLRHDPALTRHDTTGEGTPKPLRADPSKPGGQVRAAQFDTWPEEANWVADRIVDLRRRGALTAWSQAAVLVRRNKDMPALFQALTEREVPTEIVGLGGLLTMPEVADVVATLRLLDDVAANPSLLQLLAGPRWRIGHRDLALLGERASAIARGGSRPAERVRDLHEDLVHAVADTDAAEVVSLLDAVADPGDAQFSDAARHRFARFSDEMARLRRHSDEPVLDLVRRVITTIGLDVELAAGLGGAPGPEQLAAFVDAVASYVDVDAEASLSGVLDWLDAERDYGVGLEQATPSERNSVKLLTVHRAKGLEWDAVFVPGLNDKVFPSDRVTDNWTRASQALPAHLRGDADSIPQVSAMDDAGMKSYGDDLKREARHAEDRLAYVAVTRARDLLVASCHTWQANTSRPRQPSPYFEAILDEATAQGHVDAVAAEPSPTNPLERGELAMAWPVPPDPELLHRRRVVAELVNDAVGAHDQSGQWPEPEGLTLDELAEVAEWDHTIELLHAESRGRGDRASVPDSLSASMVVEAARDAAGFAEQMLRPMPRKPSRSAALGSRFHHWIQQHYGTINLTEPLLEVPDDTIETDGELQRLQDGFLATRWAQRAPLAVEMPFTMMVGGEEVRGQIEAAFTREAPDLDGILVDWKTSERPADDLQLSIYRLAWCQATGADPQRVGAVFVHVGSGTERRPASLASLAQVEQVLGAGGQALATLRQAMGH